MATNDRTDIAPGVVRSQALSEASKEARTVELETTKLFMTTSAGALTISVGFLLAERSEPLPGGLLPYVAVAWTLLTASMVIALVNWGLTVHYMNANARTLLEVLLGQRDRVENFSGADKVREMLFWAMGATCIGGLGSLCYVAVQVGKHVLR